MGTDSAVMARTMSQRKSIETNADVPARGCQKSIFEGFVKSHFLGKTAVFRSPCGSCPLRAVHLSRHKWPEGISCPLTLHHAKVVEWVAKSKSARQDSRFQKSSAPPEALDQRSTASCTLAWHGREAVRFMRFGVG